MLESVKIQRRQSEIRQALAELVGKESPSDDETRSMETLDTEYRSNETRYRAALIAEDEERQEAKDDLETRSDKEYAELVDKFELRQVALALDEGRQLDGPTAEIVQELRQQGGYQGVPVPWQALEQRAGETVASGTPDPVMTRPIIDRLFPQSVAGRMGAQMINVDHGDVEYPVTTQGAQTGWQASETGDVGSPQAYQTTDKPLAPDNTLGTQMTITRKTMKQSGAALEAAVRRDMNAAIGAAMDQAVFLGAGSSGEPEGVITNSSYGITETPIDAAPTWAVFRAAVARFLVANAANAPGQVRLLIRPEVWDDLDDTVFDSGSGITEWDRLVKHIPAQNVVMSSNALHDPATMSPVASDALLTVTANGVAPIFVGTWGAVDLIRDPFTKAASGSLVLTALATMDITVARAAQLEILGGIARAS